MSRGRTDLFVLSAAALLSTGVLPAACRAQPPRPGEVRKATVITVSLAVGSTEKEVKRVTYTPPPGWYVRGHAVECKEKTGHSSFTVNTVPTDWVYVTEEQVKESYRAMIELAAPPQHAGVRARLAAERDQALSELRRCRSSHHALVVEAVAKGEGGCAAAACPPP
ncbi:MAG: hypothetical protein U0797_20730 [Gemmataceae bacterium]